MDILPLVLNLVPTASPAVAPVANVGSTLHLLGGELPEFHLGERFSAQVARGPEGRPVLELAGARIGLADGTPLRPGQQLIAQVEQVAPAVILRLEDAIPPTEAVAVRLLRESEALARPAGESLRALRQAVADVPTDRGAVQEGRAVGQLGVLLDRLVPRVANLTGATVAATVRQGGVFLEAQLGRATDGATFSQVAAEDVKGLLLRVVQEAEGRPSPSARAPEHREEPLLPRRHTDPVPDRPSPDRGAPVSEPAATEPWARVVDAAARHLDHVETQQALHVLARQREFALPLQIPFIADGSWHTARLAVERDANRGAEDAAERGYRILLHLELEHLGPTRVDARFDPHSAQVVLYVENEHGLKRLRTELPGLDERLRALGTREVLLAVRPWSRTPPDLRGRFAALEAGGLGAAAGLVDLRA